MQPRVELHHISVPDRVAAGISVSERRSRTTTTLLLETAKLIIHTPKFLKVDDS